MAKKVLIIAAHPDDEVLGCGATMARLAAEGHEVYTAILGEGITSRDTSRQPEKHLTELTHLKNQIKEANLQLGVKEVFTFDLPDNRFDSLALLDVVKVVESLVAKIQPEILFTHYEKDLNVDHGVTYRAVLTATRPMVGQCVREIYAFEVLSATEWNYPLSFSPNVFFDITSFIEQKVAAMALYTSELRPFPHPRSLEGIRLAAQYRGMAVGLGFAEAFMQVRSLK